METADGAAVVRPLQSTENTQAILASQEAISKRPQKLYPEEPPRRKRKRGEPEKLIDYLWWASRKKMKKAGVLYANEFEDRVTMPKKYPIAWTTLRQLQCRELSLLLVIGNPLVPADKQKDVQSSIMYEIECIIDFILGHTKAVQNIPMGTSALWVVLLFQHHVTLSKGKDSKWDAENAKDAKAIGLEDVCEYLYTKVTGATSEGGWRKLSTMEPIEPSSERKKEALAMRLLLSKAEPNMEFCPTRKRRKYGPWLFKGIEDMEMPLHVEDHAVGDSSVAAPSSCSI